MVIGRPRKRKDELFIFMNGEHVGGRHDRLMTDIVLVHLLNRNPFTWGSGNLVNARVVDYSISMRFVLPTQELEGVTKRGISQTTNP